METTTLGTSYCEIVWFQIDGLLAPLPPPFPRSVCLREWGTEMTTYGLLWCELWGLDFCEFWGTRFLWILRNRDFSPEQIHTHKSSCKLSEAMTYGHLWFEFSPRSRSVRVPMIRIVTHKSSWSHQRRRLMGENSNHRHPYVVASDDLWDDIWVRTRIIGVSPRITAYHPTDTCWKAYHRRLWWLIGRVTAYHRRITAYHPTDTCWKDAYHRRLWWLIELYNSHA